ncbi:ATP/GTP-binding protein [Schumannella sp. 10F1B-5-1]|uniref:GTP-binding protein n=1 Tax=Schumannella sp. 10F1B-5-1 TaxID=2590780 RepID=UPI001131EF9A|nr:ATP/GTP-binding protein [Schumannella sp. 10F1B-5-1]TPW72287.1 ATP-binding protein [Schumannella sp. 10F1B-5-1]
MAEHVILFAGPMGAGKTTAIRSLSEIDVVSTEAANSERHVVDKATTTVALDYGEITLGAEDKVRLYGVPGQKRFDFMWSILKKRARGMIMLINDDAPDAVQTMIDYLDDFSELYDQGGVVIGVSRTDLGVGPGLQAYTAALAEQRPQFIAPVFGVDPRDENHMRTVLMTLIANIEMRAMLAPAAEAAAP